METATVEEFLIPADTMINAKSRLVVYFDTERRTPLHTGFKIPGSGATLCLFDSESAEADRVTFGEQEDNVSYGRFKDGLPVFVFDSIPSPNRANQDNGSVPPKLDMQPFDLANLQAGQPIQFSARGRDDIGILNMGISYRRLDGNAGAQAEWTTLYDDGMHADGGMTDGLFANTLPSLPQDGSIQYFIYAWDLSGNYITYPDDPVLIGDSENLNALSLGFGAVPEGLEISEIVADNETGVTDEGGGTPDYIELRNTSDHEIILDGLILAQSLTAPEDEQFVFPAGTVLAPGEHIIIYADENTDQGPLHTPFKIDSGGDRILLLGRNGAGALMVIDGIDSIPLSEDEALLRIGNSGFWITGDPSAGRENVMEPMLGTVNDQNGNPLFLYTFPTETGKIYRPEYSETLAPGSWSPMLDIIGNGSAGFVTMPMGESGFFRVWKSE
jgi:hypothetical protein